MQFRLFLLIFSALALLPLARAAEGDKPALTPKAALERVLKAETLEAAWFDDSFLQAVPIAQVKEILGQLTGTLGKYQEVQGEDSAAKFTVVYEKGTVPFDISLDAEGRIAGLFFQPPTSKAETTADLLAEFKALPGKVSVLALGAEDLRVEYNVEEVVAVGSAFKLPLLAALRREVEAGRMSWEQVVKVEDAKKSLPSGVMQDWPAGTPVTLGTLATLMISLSDNTATDHLMALLPADGPYLEGNRLSTREAFVLKSRAGKALREEYLSGDAARMEAARKATADKDLPGVEEFTKGPVHLGVEWFYSMNELATYMEQVKELPLMQVNAGGTNKVLWDKVAFKGGSESGVLCLVTWGKTRDGREILLAAAWNNPDAVLDEVKFSTLYYSLLEKLRTGTP